MTTIRNVITKQNEVDRNEQAPFEQLYLKIDREIKPKTNNETNPFNFLDNKQVN